MAAMSTILDFRSERLYFFFQVTPILPIKFRVNWPFGSGEEGKIDFQDGHLRLPIETILALFDLQAILILLAKFQVNWLSVQAMFNTDFQDGGNGGHLGFPFGTILANFFYLQCTLMLPIKIQVYWPFGYIYFQDGRQGRHLG